MGNNVGFEKIGIIIKSNKTKKPPKYEWQDFALRIIDELGVPKHKRSSIFKVCRDNPKPFVEKCFDDTRELCKKGKTWLY
ncbi:MAG: hypothetical protein U9R06_01605, partial [Patescibacteria group bacterium]|nr:hypothetical protein [Patescibacteria group bacterium]